MIKDFFKSDRLHFILLHIKNSIPHIILSGAACLDRKNALPTFRTSQPASYEGIQFLVVILPSVTKNSAII